MIRPAKEGSINWLPGLSLDDIPHPLPAGISLHVRGGEIGLEVQGLVGAIPLSNGDTLQIISKIGQVNFLRLLFRAEGNQRDLERAFDEFVAYSVEDEANIDRVVARQLFRSVGEIIKRSPKAERINRQKIGLYAAGRINAPATALNLACRRQEPVVYVASERTVDIAENRVLTEALLRAWPMVAEDDSPLRWVIGRWLERFPRSWDLRADLHHVEQAFASGQYGGPRDYYRRALMLARVLLGSAGLGFDEASVLEGDAVLLSTPDIYEKYLRNVINDAYRESGHIITKGGVGTTSLYTDGSFQLEPDIVISRDGRALLVADAKYKQPSSSDHYQMHTYLSALGVKRGLLLAPMYDAEDVKIHEYATADKTVVWEAYLPMNKLNVTEAFLGKVIERFC